MTLEQIAQEMRRCRPASIVVCVEGRDDAPIAMGRGRGYDLLAKLVRELLDGAGDLPARAECRARDGSVLAVIADKRDSVQVAQAAAARSLAGIAPEHQSLIAAIDHVTDRWTKMVHGVMDAQVRALDAMAKRVEASERQSERLLRALYETTVASAGAVADATSALAEREAAANEAAGGPLAPALQTFAQAAAARMLPADKKNGAG